MLLCWLSRNSLVRLQHRGFTGDVQDLLRVVVQRRLGNHTMLRPSDGYTRRNVSRETPCVMTELRWYDITDLLA